MAPRTSTKTMVNRKTTPKALDGPSEKRRRQYQAMLLD